MEQHCLVELVSIIFLTFIALVHNLVVESIYNSIALIFHLLDHDSFFPLLLTIIEQLSLYFVSILCILTGHLEIFSSKLLLPNVFDDLLIIHSD